jgi:two-component system NtrC family sensor kinase
VAPINLKTNIAICLAVLLMLAMVLIGFVMIITAQKALLRAEILRGYGFISGIESGFMISSKSEYILEDSVFQAGLRKMLTDAEISCALVLDKTENRIYSDGKNCELHDELESFAGETIQTGLKTTRFFGSTWGVFWRQSRDLMIGAPLFQKGRIVGACSIVMPLAGIYKVLRRTQYVLLIYLFVNTVVFTIIGLYRLSRITVKPLQRLVKRAEAYTEEDEMFFLYEAEENEFSKLSKALNRMLQHIAGDKEKLHAVVMSLEKANVDLIKAQKDMIGAEKLACVGRLSAGIAHEIGNPIGIIVGYLELLQRNDISDNDRKEFFKRTENEINRIDTIIRQLLEVSKPLAQGLKIVSVNEILQETVDSFKFHPLMSDIDLDFKFMAERDTVMADPNRLRQVFLNLIINAADAVSSNKNRSTGKISIISEVVPGIQAESTDHPNMLKIEYIDNGPGIAEENLGNIFDPFFTTKGPGKGTGLGLSVCFMIVEGIGGKIKAGSKEGKGATITIYLPLNIERNP